MEEATQPQIVSVAQSNPAVPGLHLHEFTSRVFRNTRMLRVWVPPGYNDAENSARRYPVFYLNDGQNLFDPATAHTGEDWQVDEAADRLIRENKISPMILVGLDNAQKERMREYLPYRSLHPTVLRAQGRKYPDFLWKEVIPFIGRNYRIDKSAENTGLGGSSLGALIALHTAIVRPGVFGRLLLESPSLFIAGRKLLKQSRSFRDWPARIFLAIGTRETGRSEKDEETVEDVRELEHIFRRAGLGAGRLKVEIDEGAPHSESAWARRFPQALSFLFGK